MNSWWLNLQYNLEPVIFRIPGTAFGVRWYSLGYIIAFILCYLLVNYRIKHDPFAKGFTKKIIDDSFFYLMLAVIIGARLGYFLFYDTATIFTDPLSVILPFSFKGGFHITGYSGMSYHGGVVMLILVFYLLARKYKKNMFAFMDLFIPAIPIGYTFGRLGNFMNGELYGRITASAQGMLFEQAQKVKLSLPRVQTILDKLGWTVKGHTVTDSSGNIKTDLIDKTGLYINLPRYPSQLYEALGEGVLLFLVLWFIRNKNFTSRRLWALYLTGYGVIRFFIEYLRWPDQGYFGNLFTKGQLLCLLMILAGITAYYLISKRQKYKT
ncbi:MAG TPA: prolipoprotein diacylglyceryl transferase [Spirochaetota bacterium]|nr:prolipoprotein diacylglyceryl transferase [Spirochaetota bacterium]